MLDKLGSLGNILQLVHTMRQNPKNRAPQALSLCFVTSHLAYVSTREVVITSLFPMNLSLAISSSVCSHLYGCVFIWIYKFIHVSYFHTYAPTYIYAYMYSYTCIHIKHIFVHIHTYVHVQLQIPACIYTHTFTTNVHISTHIYIHKCTHVHKK